MSKEEELLHIWLKPQSFSLWISGPHLQIGSQQSAYHKHAILGLTIRQMKIDRDTEQLALLFSTLFSASGNIFSYYPEEMRTFQGIWLSLLFLMNIWPAKYLISIVCEYVATKSIREMLSFNVWPFHSSYIFGLLRVWFHNILLQK